MQTNSNQILQINNVHQDSTFGLSGLKVYPLENTVQNVVNAEEVPVNKNKFVALFYRRFKQVAVFIFVFSFLVLVQDFAYHYMENKHFAQYSHHGFPINHPIVSNDDNIQVLVDLDDSFSANPQQIIIEQPSTEDLIIEEKETLAKDNSISNNTYSQVNVDTNIEQVNNNDSSFYIIVGTFKQEANADRLSYSLKMKGIEANIITTTHVSRVSIAKFFNRKNAEDKLNSYQNFDKNVWVYACAN